MTDPLLAQDLQKLLALLQEGPKTHGELMTTMRLSSARIASLIRNLQQRGQIYAPRCVADSRGRTVNLWELRNTESIPEPGKI
jgi:predicted ArsR family transcriptional regulator